MDRPGNYLRIPDDYCRAIGGLRWSRTAEAVVRGDGETFAFATEIGLFLSGFGAQAPLIHFSHVLHLIFLLRDVRRPDDPFAMVRQPTRHGGYPQRNAGQFCALLCKDVPLAVDPPTVDEVWQRLVNHPFTAPADFLMCRTPGDPPALGPAEFEERIRRALGTYTAEEIWHWLMHGFGGLEEPAREVAEEVVAVKPPTLGKVLDALAEQERLTGAAPYVGQMVSALTLPPRRLASPELPVGGYSDVTTRGNPEQILPAQFALDDLEFLRRYAEKELLFYRREEPHQRTREELVLLLDQGVRTWGPVRLLLAATVFALGRLAERRRIPLLVAATSDGGKLYDPLTAKPDELGELLGASDLSADPSLALERILEEPVEGNRDVVLLTHPRNLGEQDVHAAACRVGEGVRLFAVSADAHGEIQLSEVRHGSPVKIARFHVDLEAAAPPPPQHVTDDTAWRGDVEPIGFPFRFGIGRHNGPLKFAFDVSGDWLLVASRFGMLYAVRTDGSGWEILPRPMHDGRVLTEVEAVVGVAGGFVVAGPSTAWHYDFSTRNCRVHTFQPDPGHQSGLLPAERWYYLLHSHTLALVGGLKVQTVHLTTGQRDRCPAAVGLQTTPLASNEGVIEHYLPLQVESELSVRPGERVRPLVRFRRDRGTLVLIDVKPEWDAICPLRDGKPMLIGASVNYLTCQGQTLVGYFYRRGNPSGELIALAVRGPEGIPLGEFPHPTPQWPLALSANGRLLARQVGVCKVEVRDIVHGSGPRCFAPVGKFHGAVEAWLGDGWLYLRIDGSWRVIKWQTGELLWAVELGVSSVDLREHEFVRSALPPAARYDEKRFVRVARSRGLTAVLDAYGQVVLFDKRDQLVCAFFAFRRQLAAWMPDGTRFGPESLLGRPPTPDAARRIGQALLAAEKRGEVSKP